MYESMQLDVKTCMKVCKSPVWQYASKMYFKGKYENLYEGTCTLYVSNTWYTMCVHTIVYHLKGQKCMGAM